MRVRNRDAPFFERLPHPLSLRTQFTPLAAHAALAPRVRNLRSHVESGMPHLTSVPADGGRTVPGRLAWQSNCLTIASVGKPPTPIHCSHIGARGCRIGTTGGPPHPGVKFTPGPQAPPHIRRLIPHPIIHVPN